MPSVSKQDFIQYYEEQNLSLSSEGSFIQLLEKSWGISENEDNENNKGILNEKLKAIRQRLLDKLKEKPTFDNVMKLFMSFDVQTSFSLTFFEFQNAIKRLQITIEEKLLGSLLIVGS